MGLVTESYETGIQHAPAAATQATISAAADAGGFHVAKGCTVSVATGATASGIITFNLRDGATGAGTIIWSCKLSAAINGSDSESSPPLNIRGTRNTAMTLESSGAGAATSELTVALNYITCKENYVGV
jgi:hypothetical protein